MFPCLVGKSLLSLTRLRSSKFVSVRVKREIVDQPPLGESVSC